MTRIGIISDVHADVHALQDALARIAELGCAMTVCCGDIVDYGLFPEETITLLRERRVLTIRGNHDRWAISEGHDVSGWDLTPAAARYLEGLPPRLTMVTDGVAIAVHHARSGSDMDGIYDGKGPFADSDTAFLLEQAAFPVPDLRAVIGQTARTKMSAPQVLIVGHTHIPTYRRCDLGIIINPGCLLRDWNEDGGVPPRTGGTFAVLETPSLHFTVYDSRDGAVRMERP